MAFVGETASGTAVYVTDGPNGGHRVSFEASGNRDYGRTASINNAGQVSARDLFFTTADSNLRRWDADGSGDWTFVATTSDFNIFEPEEFETIASFTDINDNNLVVFWGTNPTNGTRMLRVRSDLAGPYIQIGDFPSTTNLRPQISDTAEVVFRSSTNQSILKTDPLSGTFRRVAGPPEGFGNMGASPGVTWDGDVVAFYGEHATAGAGVYISVLKPGGSRTSGSTDRWIIPIAGAAGAVIGNVTNPDTGDVIGSLFQGDESELGLDPAGGPLGLNPAPQVLSEFSADSRVGVSGTLVYAPNSQSELFVTYLAKDPRAVDGYSANAFQGNESLWQSRVIVRVDANGNPSFDVKDPQRVASVGETLLGRQIADLEIYDPVNESGQIAFWASLAGGGQAIFRASTSPDTDGDGLLDFWETNGIDIDEDGVVDLDLAAMGASVNQRDLFLEVDWLASTSGSNNPLVSREPVTGLDSFIAGMFASAPGGPIKAHVDGGVFHEINMGGAKLKGGTVVPQVDVVHFGSTAPTVAGVTSRSFFDIKRENFGGGAGSAEQAARELVFHYTVFSDFHSFVPVGVGASGQALWSSGVSYAGNVDYDADPDPDGAELIADESFAPPFSGQKLIDMMVGSVVKITGGPGAGQFRVIAGYDPAKRRMTFDRPWGVVPDGSTFVVFNGSSGLAEAGFLRDATDAVGRTFGFPDHSDSRARPGNDVIVSLGGWYYRGVNQLGFAQEQTLAHELGHNLGLGHEGVDPFGNYNPDYKSLMNYEYQFDPAVRSYSGSADLVSDDWAAVDLDFMSFNSAVFSSFGSALGESDEPEPDVYDFLEKTGQTAPDVSAPFVAIDAPNAVGVGGALEIGVTATDDISVFSVEVSFDGDGDGVLGEGETVRAVRIGQNQYRAVLSGITGPSGERLIRVSADDLTLNTTTAVQAVTVTAGTNAAPSNILLSSAALFEAAPGAVVGQLSAVDPDAGDTHTFTVSDFRFEVTAAGVLRLKAGVALDYEVEKTVAVSVTATDAGGLSMTKAFTLQVLNRPAVASAVVLLPTGRSYALPAGRTAPWRVSAVRLAFDAGVAVAAGDLTATDPLGQAVAFSAAGFSYDAAARAATWTFAVPVEAARLRLALSGSVSLAGSPGATLEGGDPAAGGAWLAGLNVLWGDVNGDGKVTIADPVVARDAIGKSNPYADANGDGKVTISDPVVVRNRIGAELPAAAFVAGKSVVARLPAFGPPVLTSSPVTTILTAATFPAAAATAPAATVLPPAREPLPAPARTAMPSVFPASVVRAPASLGTRDLETVFAGLADDPLALLVG